MRFVAPIALALLSCEAPPYVGKLCDSDRPCPAPLVCSREGTCLAEDEPQVALNLAFEGPGAGVVTSDPVQLRCEEDCSVDFAESQMVRLSAFPKPGSGFSGWRGACAGVADCVLRMDGARSVTASFGRQVEKGWLVRWGGTADDAVTGLTTDGAGRTIAAGYFSTTVPFEGESRVSRGGRDGFVAALSPGAELDWVVAFGGTGNEVAFDVAAELDGSLHVGGLYSQGADVFGETPAPLGLSDPLWARLSDAGVRQQSATFGSDGNDVVSTLLPDGQGGALVAGYFGGPFAADALTRGHVGGDDAYLVHFDSAGAATQVEVFGGTGDDRISTLAYGADRARFAALGTFQGTVAFGGEPLTSTTTYGLFAAVFSSDGEHVWSALVGGVQTQVPVVAHFDPEGALVLAADAALIKLNGRGELVWRRRFDGFVDITSLAVDRRGAIVVGGSFGGTVDFGGGALQSAGASDGMVLKLDGDGNHLWSRRIGGMLPDGINAVALDAAGNVVAGGDFQGTVDFGSTVLVSAGGRDAFLLSLGL